MGYNSAIYINNDAMSVIDDDPVAWWAEIRHALSKVSSSGEPVTVSFRGFANYFEAILNQHADFTSIVAIGGGHTTTLHRRHSYRHSTEADKLQIVKEMADSLGYRLVPKKG